MKAGSLTRFALAFILLYSASARPETFPPEDGEAPKSFPANDASQPENAPAESDGAIESELTEMEAAVDPDAGRSPASSDNSDEALQESEDPGSDAEERVLRPKRQMQKKMLRPKRSLQGLERSESLNAMRAKHRSRSRRKSYDDVVGRVAVVAGLSTVASANAQTQTVRDEQGLGQNYYLGFQADVRSFKYLAAHIDLFYGIAPTQEITSPSTGAVENRKLQQMGGLALLQLGYPIDIKGWGFFPHVGGGYGAMRLTQYAEPVQAGTVTSTTNAKATQTALQPAGPVVEVGLEAEPSPGYLLFADYAMSVSGSGSATTVTNIGNVAPIAVDATSFTRIRVGGVLPITNEVLLGLQAIRRVATLQVKNVADPTMETLTQFLGVFAYRF